MVLHSQISFAKQNRMPVKPKPKVARYVLELDGVDDYVNVNTSSSLSLSGAITMSVWVKKNIDKNQFLIQKRGGVSGSGYRVWIKLDNGIYIELFSQTSVRYYAYTTDTFESGVSLWHNVVCIYNGSSFKIFFDGIEQVLDIDKNEGAVDYTSDEPLSVGRESTGTNYFNGSIADVRIYNRALSAAEITQLYQGVNIRNGLILHHNYRLGHARDLSGNGNDGTLNNGAKFNIVNYEEV